MEKLVKAAVIAQHLDMTVRTVINLATAGRIPARKLPPAKPGGNNLWRFSLEDVLASFEDHEVETFEVKAPKKFTVDTYDWGEAA